MLYLNYYVPFLSYLFCCRTFTVVPFLLCLFQWHTISVVPFCYRTFSVVPFLLPYHSVIPFQLCTFSFVPFLLYLSCCTFSVIVPFLLMYLFCCQTDLRHPFLIKLNLIYILKPTYLNHISSLVHVNHITATRFSTTLRWHLGWCKQMVQYQRYGGL